MKKENQKKKKRDFRSKKFEGKRVKNAASGLPSAMFLKVLSDFQLSPGGEEGEKKSKIRNSRKEVSLRRLVPAPTLGISQ